METPTRPLFDNQEQIYFTKEDGSIKGKGVVVGHYQCPISGNLWIIYPKNPLFREKWMCLVLKDNEVISAPF